MVTSSTTSPTGEGNNSIFPGRARPGDLRLSEVGRWPTTNQDFDLYLVPTSQTCRSCGARRTSRAAPSRRSSGLLHEPRRRRDVLLRDRALLGKCAAPPRPLRHDRKALQYRCGGQHPRAGDVAEAFAVGAICWKGNGLEPYSSLGPDDRRPHQARHQRSGSSDLRDLRLVHRLRRRPASPARPRRRRTSPEPPRSGKGSIAVRRRATRSEAGSRATRSTSAPAGLDSSFGFGKLADPPIFTVNIDRGRRRRDPHGVAPPRAAPARLRAAIQEANAQAGRRDLGSAGHVRADAHRRWRNQVATGDLDITNDVLIGGAGAATIVDGNGTDRSSTPSATPSNLLGRQHDAAQREHDRRTRSDRSTPA